jgi:hypothetical protein
MSFWDYVEEFEQQEENVQRDFDNFEEWELLYPVLKAELEADPQNEELLHKVWVVEHYLWQ